MLADVLCILARVPQVIRDLWKQEQETAFEYLTALKNHAVQTNDAERASLAENLGRQFVRILLDKQDKELALSMQHRGLQEDSLHILEEIHKDLQKMAAAHANGDVAGNQHVAELEEEVSRHIALEQEASFMNTHSTCTVCSWCNRTLLLTLTDKPGTAQEAH